MKYEIWMMLSLTTALHEIMSSQEILIFQHFICVALLFERVILITPGETLPQQIKIQNNNNKQHHDSGGMLDRKKFNSNFLFLSSYSMPRDQRI